MGLHYDDIRDEVDEALTRKERMRKQRMLEQALGDVMKLSCWRQDKDWSITEIRCVDLFTAIEDRIKSQLYDLRSN